MKREDLFDAITNIDDKMIEEAGQHRFLKKYGRLAAVLGPVAAVLLVGIILITTTRIKSTEDSAAPSSNFSSVANFSMVKEKAEATVPETDGTTTGDINGMENGIPQAIIKAEVPEMETGAAAEVKEDFSYTIDSTTESFSAKLLRNTLAEKDGKNKIVSPMNIYLATGMLAEVTEGDSRKQVLDALNESDIDALRENAKGLWNKNYVDDEIAKSLLGSSIWLNGVNPDAFNRESLQKLADYYYADSFYGKMGSQEFNEVLHNWMNEHTGNMLTEQVGGINFTPDTIAAICTTIYFKGSWVNEFNDARNTTETFHAANGDAEREFMNQTQKATMYFGKKYAASALGMNDGYSMMFVLPKDGYSPEDLLMDDEALSFILDKNEADNSDRYKVNYTIPKFDVDSQLELAGAFSKMGIEDVFDAGKADFSTLTTEIDPIFLSSILHGARVKIDEQGCEAAAYTMMNMMTTAFVELPNYDFIVNKPFIFEILNHEGLPMFVGIVNEIK